MKNVLAYLCLMAAVPSSFAAASPEAEQRAAQTAMSASAQHLKVKSFFDGPGGLIGLRVVDNTGAETIVFSTPDGRYIILPAMIMDDTGKNLMADYLAAMQGGKQPAPQSAPSGGVPLAPPDVSVISPSKIPDLAGLESAPQGHGPIDLWVLGDPLCPHCRDAHLRMNDPKLDSRFTMHWILTSFIGGDESRVRAANVLDKRISLDQAYTQDQNPKDPPTGASLAKVDSATGFLVSLGNDPRVPAVIFRRSDGGWGLMKGFDADRLIGLAVATPPLGPSVAVAK